MVDECVESLQTVEQSQLLQVQVVVFTHLSLQELAAKVHHSAHLKDHRQGLFPLYLTFLNTLIFGIQTESEYLTTLYSFNIICFSGFNNHEFYNTLSNLHLQVLHYFFYHLHCNVT